MQTDSCSVQFSLCFACGDGSVGPSPLHGVAMGCAVGFWIGLCAADSGNDGCGGCKAHGCGLLVKTGCSGPPLLCLHDASACCRNSGLDLPDYRY